MSSLVLSMREIFEQFVRDRRYLKGVRDRIVEWYWESWASFAALENATFPFNPPHEPRLRCSRPGPAAFTSGRSYSLSSRRTCTGPRSPEGSSGESAS